MIHRIYSVHDSAAEAYLLPFLLPTKGLAIRGFGEAVNNPKHDFSKYAEQYVLFELGTFNDATASFEIYSKPLNMGVGVEFKDNSAIRMVEDQGQSS